jgi:hypothetical protein
MRQKSRPTNMHRLERPACFKPQPPEGGGSDDCEHQAKHGCQAKQARRGKMKGCTKAMLANMNFRSHVNFKLCHLGLHNMMAELLS